MLWSHAVGYGSDHVRLIQVVLPLSAVSRNQCIRLARAPVSTFVLALGPFMLSCFHASPARGLVALSSRRPTPSATSYEY